MNTPIIDAVNCLVYNEYIYLTGGTTMNNTWNLDSVYLGFEDPAFEADFSCGKEKIAQFSALTETLSFAAPLEALRTGIMLQEEIYALSQKMAMYASLRQYANSRDTAAQSQLGRIMGVFSAVAAPAAAFQEWAAGLPNLMELVESDELLQQYRFLFSKMKESSRYLLGSQGEAIMAKMQLSGGNAWADLHTALTSTVPVSYRGTTINLPAVRNLAYDPDPQVRKDAFEAEQACYAQIKEPVAFALNSIKLETLSDCELRGYDSPLARTLKEADMSRATLDAMLSAMDDYLPHFWRYLKAKAKALGHEAGLPWYDISAPMGSTSTLFTAEEARNYLVEHFASFDQELADVVARAFDEAWIDFYPRDGKTGGAFCEGVQCLKESRILTNFDGTFSAVSTLAHELGHAFHNHCVFPHRYLNRDYSMPVAETASIFNECLISACALNSAADTGEKLSILESSLNNATMIICDIYSRFRFEAMVFENRKEKFMNADDLCALMLDAQKQSYGDGLDHNCLHPYMWVNKPHYYGPTFYNFPYAFGGLFARGLYAQYQSEGAAFVPKYKKLLYTTSVATAEDAAKVAGVDLTDKNFWCAALQTIVDEIDQFCSLLEE